MPRTQRGQALVLGLFVLFMGTISLFFRFSTGQVAADKQRVTNTADAAAYSAALWRARVLNYDAYSNRAMIANEVAIAQTLTLASELQFNKNLAACFAQQSGDGGTTCDANLAQIAQIIPYWTSIFSAIQYVLEYADQAMTGVIDVEITARSRVVNQTLSRSQQVMHAAANFAVLDGLVDQVVEMNDRNFRSTVLPDDFGGLVRRYEGNDRNRMAAIVRRQLDPYSQDRHWDLPLGFCIDRVVAFGYIYRKRGSTVLANSLDRWEAQDNLAERPQDLDKRRRCREDENPMSWADRNAEGQSNPVPRRTRDNRESFDLSRDNDYTVDSYIGIQPFYDLDYRNLTNGDPNVRNPRRAVAVAVSLPGANVRTANNLNVGVGRLRMTEDFERGRITSVGAAEVYFKRPVTARRADGAVELPSLFNPYWQARLIEPTLPQRTAARAL
jgi:hypothetical protein